MWSYVLKSGGEIRRTSNFSFRGNGQPYDLIAARNYDRFKFYNFYCNQQELDDAKATHEICNEIGVSHKIYSINVTIGQDIFNFEVTMPMNNRRLMDMFLWYPHDFRKNDMLHKAIILHNEPKFAHIKNEVHNGYFSEKRIVAEKYYYYYRMFIYKLGNCETSSRS